VLESDWPSGNLAKRQTAHPDHEDFEAVRMAFAGLTVLVVDFYLAVLGA